jgi:hypothetical protein
MNYDDAKSDHGYISYNLEMSARCTIVACDCWCESLPTGIVSTKQRFATY